VLRRAQHQQSQYSEKLATQQDWIETRLSREIERTDLMQSEMSNMKSRFAAHLQRLSALNDEAHATHAVESQEMKTTLQVRTLPLRSAVRWELLARRAAPPLPVCASSSVVGTSAKLTSVSCLHSSVLSLRRAQGRYSSKWQDVAEVER
jgi:hypothetical protein